MHRVGILCDHVTPQRWHHPSSIIHHPSSSTHHSSSSHNEPWSSSTLFLLLTRLTNALPWPEGQEEVTATVTPSGCAILTLNRPSALNALNLNMCAVILSNLLQWRSNPHIHCVILIGAPLEQLQHAKAFCAGGDVNLLTNPPYARYPYEFFLVEYAMDMVVSEYPKPVVAMMTGITMGGGVGLSWPAMLRIVTDQSLWAMPETAIGLFPDVGATHWLARGGCRHGIGMFLGLTGSRLNAMDCIDLGIATHYIAPHLLSAFLSHLMKHVKDGPLVALSHFASTPTLSPRLHPLTLPSIRAIFHSPANLLTIMDALQQCQSATTDTTLSGWATTTLTALQSASPVSLKVTHHAIARAMTAATTRETFNFEFRLVCRLSTSADFKTGVRSVVLSKGKHGPPLWSPSHLSLVTEDAVRDTVAPLDLHADHIPEYSVLISNIYQ